MHIVSGRLVGMGFASCITCGASGLDVPFRMVLLGRPDDRLRYVCEPCSAGIPTGKVTSFEIKRPAPAFEQAKKDLFEGLL